MNSVLYIVIPCYNEETVLPITSKMFLDKLTSLIHTNKVSDTVESYLLNDREQRQSKGNHLQPGEAGRAFYRHFPEPQPRSSKCGSRWIDGGKR